MSDTLGDDQPAPVTVTNLVVPGPAAGVSARSLGVPNAIGSIEVPIRSYEPAASPVSTLVWAHGGSFVRGGLDWPESDWVAARLAEHGVRVLAVDYVLAGDHAIAPAPAGDVSAVVRWARARFDGPLAVGGASAGGHLAASAALKLASGESPIRLAALLLAYPTLHRVQRAAPEIARLTRNLPQQRQFDAARIAEMYAVYLGSTNSPATDALSESPYVIGERDASDLTRLPSTTIVTAEADDLRASAEQFAEQLTEAGVPVDLMMQPGTVHGYLNRPDESAVARSDALATIRRFARALGAVDAEDGRPAARTR